MKTAKVMTPAGIAKWFRDPSNLEVWEDIAAWLHKETGYLRPGKDKPIGFHTTEDGASDCCMDAWLLWAEEKRSEATRGLLARIKELEEERDRTLDAAVDRVVKATVQHLSDGHLQDIIIAAIKDRL